MQAHQEGDRYWYDITITTWLFPAPYDRGSVEWLKRDGWRKALAGERQLVADISGWQSDKQGVRVQFLLRVGERIEDIARVHGKMVCQLASQIESEQNKRKWLRLHPDYRGYLQEAAA